MAASILQGVASPFVYFCLGSDALRNVHKYSKFMRKARKGSSGPREGAVRDDNKIFVVKEQLLAQGLTFKPPSNQKASSLIWRPQDHEGTSPFAFAQSFPHDSNFIVGRVVVMGFASRGLKMYYLPMTMTVRNEVSPLGDISVKEYNCRTLAGRVMARTAEKRIAHGGNACQAETTG